LRAGFDAGAGVDTGADVGMDDAASSSGGKRS